MEAFWKAAAVVVLTIILSVAIGKTEKDISLVLSITACCIALMVGMRYLSDVVVLLWELGNGTDSQNPYVGNLLKITGVALMTEMTAMVSTDAGNNAIAKAMQILGSAAILYLSLPLLEGFISIIQEIMRNL